MIETKLNIEPRHHLSGGLCDKINQVAGHQFDNQAINLDFDQLLLNPVFDEDLLEINLMHIGIKAKGYVRASEAERLLGLKIKYLDSDYLAYLITQNVAQYGVCYQGHLKQEISLGLPSLFCCIFISENLQATIYIDIASLDIDEGKLEIKPQVLLGSLRLSTSWSPFETSLDSTEIQALSDEDLVLVFPK